jgi:hypothetical protein
VFGIFDVRSSPVDFAFEVYARFNGHEWPIGHIAHAASAGEESLRIDSDYKNYPLPQPPAKIDIIMRSSPKVASRTLGLYKIWNGEIVLKDVPIDSRPAP